MLTTIIFDILACKDTIEKAEKFLVDLKKHQLTYYLLSDLQAQKLQALPFSYIPKIIGCMPEQLIFISQNATNLNLAKEAGLMTIAYTPQQEFLPSLYCFESFSDIDSRYLIHVWHRYQHIPISRFTTKHLEIRELCALDLPRLFKIYQEPGIDTYMEELHQDYSIFTEKMQAYINQIYPLYDFGMWGVFLKGSNILIGECGIHQVTIDNNIEIEIGYLLSTKYQKKGYGREMVRATLKYANKTYDFQTIIAQIMRGNHSSIKLAEHCGFVYKKKCKKNGKVLYQYEWNYAMQAQRARELAKKTVKSVFSDHRVYKKRYHKKGEIDLP